MTIPAYRVTAHVTAYNGLNVNVFHFSNATVVPADFGAVAVDMLTGFYNTMEAAYPGGVTFQVGQIINLGTSPVTYVPFDSTPFTISTSGSIGDARQAATITWRTATATRRGRGRTFVGPVYGSAVSTSTGQWRSDFQTLLSDAASNLIDAGNTQTAPLLVYSKRAAAVYPVTGFAVPPTPHTLRSRTLR